MKKKIYIMLLCMVLGLSGCGAGSSDSKETTAGSGTGEKSSVQETIRSENKDAAENKENNGSKESDAKAGSENPAAEWNEVSLNAVYGESSINGENSPGISSVKIQINDKELGKEIQTIDYTYDFTEYGLPNEMNGEIYLQDVNFDGKDDILIHLGTYGNAGIAYYACYVWNEESRSFEQNLSFQEIMNPVPSQSEAMILSFSKDGAADYFYDKYVIENGTYLKTASLSEKISADSQSSFTEKELVNGKMTVTGENLELEQLDESKWYIQGNQWYTMPGNSAARYYDKMEEITGIKTDDAVTFFNELAENIENDNREAISSLLKYPVVLRQGNEVTRLADADKFLEFYDLIFTEVYKNAVLAGVEQSFSYSWQGVSVGLGEVWINMLDGRLYVTALNGAGIGVYLE